jgi:hypothetical protein
MKHRRPLILRIVCGVLWSLAWLVAFGCVAWTFGALHFDFPILSRFVAWGFAVAMLAAVIFVPGAWRKLGAVFLACALVLVWWRTLEPTNEADWQPDVEQLAWADINGDEVTFHNVRNCDYRSNTDYTPRWETRTVRLSQLTGVDIAIDYWGSSWIAHPIISFQFADALPVCFSIETRVKKGQTYSAIAGLYRRYEIVYTVADERDPIRLRTNIRNEDIYLYHLTLTPDQARVRFLEYINEINGLRDHPRWYNEITGNCTTSIRAQEPSHQRPPWDWRILLNGKGDELLYERGNIVTDGLPFAELKKRALIDVAAKAAGDSPEFSRLIRVDRPGFGAHSETEPKPPNSN